MADIGSVIPLHLGKSLEELNEKVRQIVTPKLKPNRLLNSAKKIFDKANLADKSRDEEEAYLFYMRYFMLIQDIQKLPDYEKEKKFYSKMIDRKNLAVAIKKCEALSTSLERRYSLQQSAEDVEKIEVANKRLEIQEKNTKPKEEKELKVFDNSVVINGYLHDEEYISCSGLNSLMKKKTSSYLILDVRLSDDFNESRFKDSVHIINIPEEILKPGFTPNKINLELREDDRSNWSRRKKVDYIIICDWITEKYPIPLPISIVRDAMQKWDHGDEYVGKILILQGGFYVWKLTYPFLTTNPRVELPECYANSSSEMNDSNLSIEYPNLDDAFIMTPTSPNSNETESSLSSATNTVPSVNRTLKPQSYVSSNEVISNDIKPMIKKINTFVTPHKKSDTDDNLLMNQQSRSKDEQSFVIPVIPSRDLKPKELIKSLALQSKTIQDEERLLEDCVKLETLSWEEKWPVLSHLVKMHAWVQDETAIKKLEEMEANQEAQKVATDDQKAELMEIRQKQQKEIEGLKSYLQEYEIKYKEMEELTNMLSKEVSQLKLNSYSVDEKPPVSSAIVSSQAEEDSLQSQKQKNAALLLQVEKMRQERKEREKLLKDRESQNNSKVVKPVEGKRNEFSSKVQEDESFSVNNYESLRSSHRDRKSSELRSSPRSSPIRSGSNLKRSHSAFNLSKLDDENEIAISPLPHFDRGKKPFDSPTKHNINTARQRNFEPKYGNVGRGKTGLKNLGNTCYMNSIIQCLNNTKIFNNYFAERKYYDNINPKSRFRGEAAEEVGAVIQALWSCQYRSIAMWDLKAVMGKIHEPFQGCDQHDAHEFLIKLTDWMHEDLNEVHESYPPMEEINCNDLPDKEAAELCIAEISKRDKSLIRTLFYGLHRSTIVCKACGHHSVTFEPFSILTLSFANKGRCALDEMISQYYKESSIEYKCSKCKKLKTSSRKIDIWKLPPVLIIHLSRFEHDILTRKKQNYVDFPIDALNLSYYSVSKTRCTTYNLYGVSNHYGTLDGGHYTAFCRSFSSQNTWHKFDDHEVYDLSRESIRTSAAYVLFYEASNI